MLLPILYSTSLLFSSVPNVKKKTTTAKSSKKQKLDLPALTNEEKRVILIQYEKKNEADVMEALMTPYLKFQVHVYQDQGTGYQQLYCLIQQN